MVSRLRGPLKEKRLSTRQIKIIVEKYLDGYVAYPLGVKGVVVGEGDTYEEALADVESAIKFHIESFRDNVLEVESLEHMTIDHLIIDMDGVLWRGAQVIPGAPEFIRFLRQRGIGFVLATNNSTRTAAQYQDRLAGFGIEVAPHEIVTSALATAGYLATQAEPGTPVYVIGGDGLRQALTEKGFVLDSQQARYVVVGMDLELTFDKLRRATLLIRAGAGFVGSNPDKTFPSEEGMIPGAGATLAALEAATGVSPVIVGKPEPIMFQQALKRLGATAATTAMIGDRLETDILGGQRAGLKTILVLSGVTKASDLAASDLKPDWVFQDVDELRRKWMWA